MFARFAVAAPSVAPPIPTITYGQITGNGTQITATIDNFSSDFGYIVSSNIGTISRTNQNITVTGLTVGQSLNILVIATSSRGLSTPSSAVTDRQPYTFRTETRTGTRFVDTTSCYTASPTEPRCPFGGTLNLAGTECCIPSGFTEEYTFTVEIRNPAPSGYLDSGFDWYRPSNITIERIPYTFRQETRYYTENYDCSYDRFVRTDCVDVNCRDQVSGSYYAGAPSCPAGSGLCSPEACGQCNVCRVGPPNYTWVAGGTCGGGTFYCSCNACCGYTYTRVCDRQCTDIYERVNQTCSRQIPYQVDVRNPTPPNYLDSGFDWYRVL